MQTQKYSELNKQQKEAVVRSDGPSLILAGAGSGKTRVLVAKVLYLIEKCGVSPSAILMVTFTNKAAGEMKERIKRQLGFIGTFHSFCVRVLRAHGEHIGVPKEFIIYDDDDSQEIIKEILEQLSISKKHSPSFVKNKISQAKDQLISPSSYRKLFSDQFSQTIGQVYEQYQKKLEKNNAVDFDDLIYKTVELFLEKKEILAKYHELFYYILVDEFQDTNHAQYMLTKLLAQKHKNLTVVGDFSQSIYSWRGAEIKNLQKLEKDFSDLKTFYLEENYRSTQNILNFAYDVISKNQTHPILKLYTNNKSGYDVVVKQTENEQYEALFVSEQIKDLVSDESGYSTTAVLYRINAQSRIIEEAFLSLGIPYTLIGGTRFYERREIKDILSYLRLLINPEDEVSLKRIVKLGKRRFADFKDVYNKIREKSAISSTIELIDEVLQKTKYVQLYDEAKEEDYARLENIKELRSVAENFPQIHDFLEQVTLVESEYSESEKRFKNKKGVHMMTFHQAKGLEFKNVFIVGAEEGILPHSRSIYDKMSLEEERRLFYVGITRAQEKLYITHTQRRFFFGRRTINQISRFLEEQSYDSQNYF